MIGRIVVLFSGLVMSLSAIGCTGGNDVALFHAAARRGDVAALDSFLRRNNRLVVAQMGPKNPLHTAVENERVEAVELLLKRNAPPDTLDGLGKSPLFMAAEKGNLKIMGLLLDHKAAIETMDGLSPLWAAVYYQRSDATSFLLKRGAPVNSPAGQDSPLHVAIHGKNPSLVKVLLDHHANVNLLDSRGETPLEIAAFYGETEVIKMLIERNGKRTARFACLVGDLPLLKELIIKEGDIVNTRFSNDRTLLHDTTIHDRHKITEFLLELGADRNARTKNDELPLHYACQFNAPGCCRLLVTKQTVDSQDRTGNTPLQLAARKSHRQVATILIDTGSSPNIQDQDGNTPLMSAVANNNPEMCKLLLSAKCDVNKQNKTGYSALHLVFSLEETSPIIAEYLINAGANPDLRNNHNQTPRELAVFYPEILRMLQAVRK